MGTPHVWTDERIEKLKAFYAEGFSCSGIAERLGGGVTRSAVIGKIDRLGLNAEHKVMPRPKKPRLCVPKATKVKTDAPLYVPREVHAPPPLEIDGQHVNLLQLKDSMCKWPIGNPGDPDFHFCAIKPALPRPYCEAHWRAAHTRAVA